jgi:hypothetical protein
MHRGMIKIGFAAALAVVAFSMEPAKAMPTAISPLLADTPDVTLARYVCTREPGMGSGTGPRERCRWVPDRRRRCWMERGVPGSGTGPQRVCSDD